MKTQYGCLRYAHPAAPVRTSATSDSTAGDPLKRCATTPASTAPATVPPTLAAVRESVAAKYGWTTTNSVSSSHHALGESTQPIAT